MFPYKFYLRIAPVHEIGYGRRYHVMGNNPLSFQRKAMMRTVRLTGGNTKPDAV